MLALCHEREGLINKLKLTRSRPYMKNDQAYVEEKNYTHVRQFLGYERLEYSQLIESVNELVQIWSLWNNIYSPTLKQLSCYREGSKRRRRHEKEAQTPAQRLLQHPGISDQAKKAIQRAIQNNDPIDMKEEIERRLAYIWALNAKLQECTSEYQCDEVTRAHGKLNLRYAPIELAMSPKISQNKPTNT